MINIASRQLAVLHRYLSAQDNNSLIIILTLYGEIMLETNTTVVIYS